MSETVNKSETQKKTGQPYYYDITGDVRQGDNKDAKQFSTTVSKHEFPLATRFAIQTQAQGWEGAPADDSISPLFANLAGVVPAGLTLDSSAPEPSNA
jgi:hypothetical protein